MPTSLFDPTPLHPGPRTDPPRRDPPSAAGPAARRAWRPPHRGDARDERARRRPRSGGLVLALGDDGGSTTTIVRPETNRTISELELRARRQVALRRRPRPASSTSPRAGVLRRAPRARSAARAAAQGTATGTGFVVDKDGHIVTAAHVVDGASSITVTFQDGTTRTAKLLGKDDATDVAVLKVDAVRPDAPPARARQLRRARRRRRRSPRSATRSATSAASAPASSPASTARSRRRTASRSPTRSRPTPR